MRAYTETILDVMPDTLTDCYVNITLNRKDCGSTPITRNRQGLFSYCDGPYGLIDELNSLLPDASDETLHEACTNIDVPILAELDAGRTSGAYQCDILAGVEVFIAWRLTRITELP